MLNVNPSRFCLIPLRDQPCQPLSHITDMAKYLYACSCLALCLRLHINVEILWCFGCQPSFEVEVTMEPSVGGWWSIWACCVSPGVLQLRTESLKWVFRGGGMVLFATDKTTNIPKFMLCTTDWSMKLCSLCSSDSLMTENSASI